MTMDTLIALVLLGLALRALHWRRGAAVALGLAMLLFFATGCGPLAAWLLRGLQAPYAQRAAIDWTPRNVILLLGAGTVRTADGIEPAWFANGRINEALLLFRHAKHPVMTANWKSAAAMRWRRGGPRPPCMLSCCNTSACRPPICCWNRAA